MRWLWTITRTGATALVLAGFVAGGARPLARQPADAAPKPNILFIMSDDHRWDGLRRLDEEHRGSVQDEAMKSRLI